MTLAGALVGALVGSLPARVSAQDGPPESAPEGSASPQEVAPAAPASGSAAALSAPTTRPNVAPTPPATSSAQSLSAPSASGAGAATPPPGPREDAPEPARERDAHPMGWASLALRLGVAEIKAGKVTNPAYNASTAAAAAQLPAETIAAYGYIGGGACTILDQKCHTPGRLGAQLVAAIHLGGDGFGWDFEPYATLGGSARAYGMYTGPKFDIHVARPVYLGFGFGVRAAYVQADGWLHGADLAARVPFHGVVYVTDQLALELDFGIGLGASGYTTRPVDIIDPVTGVTKARAPRITFGLARAWDLTVGVRFP